MQAEIAGFALGLSLILAIGSQNAFVLRQGLRREHVLAVVLVCALSDAALIAFGARGADLSGADLAQSACLSRYGGSARVGVIAI
jgi:L-lysine exporter family protein LysE/ArgO